MTFSLFFIDRQGHNSETSKHLKITKNKLLFVPSCELKMFLCFLNFGTKITFTLSHSVCNCVGLPFGSSIFLEHKAPFGTRKVLREEKKNTKENYSPMFGFIMENIK